MVVEVNTVTGNIELVNKSSDNITIDYYGIASEMNSLNPAGWGTLNSNDPGKWTKLGNENFELSEAALNEQTVILAGESIPLGNAYNTAINSEDLQFEFHLAGVPSNSLMPFAEGGVIYITDSVDPSADFDNDGDVDGSDFLAWQVGFGSGTTQAEGDANGDGSVDAADFAVWESQYGSVSGGGSLAGATVPEPSSLVLLVSVALAGAALLNKRNETSIAS